jgi:deoxycytidine triphosphate deaminase
MSQTATSVLSDATIVRLVEEGRIRIDPWEPAHVQPASVDLRLGDSFRVFHNHRASAIDLRQPPDNLTEEVVVPGEESFVIHPGEFCLGRTLEWVELPDDVVARIEGKALALDTPVPTPRGWMTMGRLAPGDPVFGLHGRPTWVIATSETMVGRPCRAVDFSDGTTLVADVEHRWPVDGGEPETLTTAEIEARLGGGERVLVGAGRAAELALAGGASRTRRDGAARGRGVGPRRDGAARGRGPRRGSCGGPPRSIVGIRECESVPVRCIEVAAPDGIFLVGRSMIPTHNSSLGRLGLIVHATAGFCDPGWKGTLTLELNNLTRVPIKLYPGLLIAQLSFMALDRPARRPYGSPELGSHYQGQRAATESRYEGARRSGELRPGDSDVR